MQAHSSHIADRALAAFIIIHAALKRSRCLRSYAARPDLQARMPNFQVRSCACQTAPFTAPSRPSPELGGHGSLLLPWEAVSLWAGRQAGMQAALSLPCPPAALPWRSRLHGRPLAAGAHGVRAPCGLGD